MKVVKYQDDNIIIICKSNISQIEGGNLSGKFEAVQLGKTFWLSEKDEHLEFFNNYSEVAGIFTKTMNYFKNVEYTKDMGNVPVGYWIGFYSETSATLIVGRVYETSRNDQTVKVVYVTPRTGMYLDKVDPDLRMIFYGRRKKNLFR